MQWERRVIQDSYQGYVPVTEPSDCWLLDLPWGLRHDAKAVKKHAKQASKNTQSHNHTEKQVKIKSILDSFLNHYPWVASQWYPWLKSPAFLQLELSHHDSHAHPLFLLHRSSSLHYLITWHVYACVLQWSICPSTFMWPDGLLIIKNNLGAQSTHTPCKCSCINERNKSFLPFSHPAIMSCTCHMSLVLYVFPDIHIVVSIFTKCLARKTLLLHMKDLQDNSHTQKNKSQSQS